MNRPVLVLTHAPWETPALVETALGDIPILHRSIVDDPSAELPPVSELGGLVVMGGPQDANDDVRHPGLPVERRTLAEAVSADVPVLGVCLGMQLLGLALGAKLHLRHGAEVGFAPIDLTAQGAADAVLAPFAEAGRPTFLHWHSDAVELPNGASLLASTPLTPVQAFRVGSALGVQFHPEADTALLGNWLATPSMVEGLTPEALAQLRRDGERHLPGLRDAALRGLGSFARAVQRRRG